MTTPAAEPHVLQLIEPPGRLRVPVVGAGSSSVEIAVGGQVDKGQPLCNSLPEGGAAVLAPTSGRIVGRSQVLLTNGKPAEAIELEPDFQDRSPRETPRDVLQAQASREVIEAAERAQPDDLGTWIDRLRSAGIWADRRTSPDLLGQLHAVFKRPIDTVICNVVDHDSTLELQGTVAGRFGPVLAGGIQLLSRLTSARNILIAVQAGAWPRWWVPLRRELRKAGIEVAAVSNDYPQADPTLLIHALLGRHLRPGRSPVEQGVLLLDGAAAAAVGRAAGRGQTMLRVPVGVRDHLRGRSSFLAVHVGTPVRHVLDHLGLPHAQVAVLAGDVLRDQPLPLDAVIAGGELSLHVMRSRGPVVPDSCIRCGWCVQVCPTRVQPAGVLEAAQRNDPEMAERYGIGACIECGVCSWVCPAHLPLLAGIREMKRRMT